MSTTMTRMMMTAIVTVRHRLGLGWLRHLSFIVVSCISWHLAVVIDCKSQPPLKIISHKILGRVGRDGGTAVSETSAWCTVHLYCLVRRRLAGLTPHPTYYPVYAVVYEGSQYWPLRWTPVTSGVSWVLYVYVGLEVLACTKTIMSHDPRLPTL